MVRAKLTHQIFPFVFTLICAMEIVQSSFTHKYCDIERYVRIHSSFNFVVKIEISICFCWQIFYGFDFLIHQNGIIIAIALQSKIKIENKTEIVPANMSTLFANCDRHCFDANDKNRFVCTCVKIKTSQFNEQRFLSNCIWFWRHSKIWDKNVKTACEKKCLANELNLAICKISNSCCSWILSFDYYCFSGQSVERERESEYNNNY